MIMAFYLVNNSMDYERHTFDPCTPDEIIEKLNLLEDHEVCFFDTTHYGWGNVPTPNMADFEQMYNDEDFDGGWWCIIINK